MTHLGISIKKFTDSKYESPETRKTYASILKRFLEYMQKQFGDDVTAQDLYDEVLWEFYTWLGEKKVKARSRNTYVAGVISWTNYAIRKKETPKEFNAERAKLIFRDNRKRQSYRAPNLNELAGVPKVVQYISKQAGESHVGHKFKTSRLVRLRNRAFVLWLYATACRQGEARSLKIKDIKSGDGTLSHEINITGKGSKERILLFENESARRAMWEYLNAREEADDMSEWLFVSHDHNLGKPITSGTGRNIVHDAGKEIGVEITPHDIRHYVLSYLMNNGAGLEVTQKIAGHSSPATTSMIYAPISVSTMRKAMTDIPLPQIKL